jgi:hypothetical protein
MSKLAIEWITTLGVIFLIIAAFGAAWQRDELKVEAVKRGFAEWVVDAEGGTTWRWKEDGE